MRRTSGPVVLWIAVLAAWPAPAGEPVHSSDWAEVDRTVTLPEDLVDPDGKTRWDLTGIAVTGRFTRVVRTADGPDGRPGWVEEAGTRSDGVLLDRRGDGSLERWLLPERDPELAAPGRATVVEIERAGARRVGREWIRVERAGLGWLHLPSGPREVVLQRAVVLRGDDEGQLQPFELIHRWVDPRAGVVAEVRGPASPDGRHRIGVDRASIVERIEQGALNLKLYIDAVDHPIREGIRFGWDRGAGTSIATLTPGGYSTMGQLVAAGAWDFSGNTPANYPTMEEVKSMVVGVTADEASAYGQCGFTANPARRMYREDRIDAANVSDNTLTVQERQGGVSSAGRILLIASHRHEELGGSGVEGEARLCHDPTTGRVAVPLWSFANQDAGGWYADLGDTWRSDPPFNCEQIIWANAVLSQMLWAKSATSSNLGPLSGRQQGVVVAEGPVTLPSGHTFNALVARTWVEYELFPFSGCSALFSFGPVRTVIHLWEVPFIGTVVRLQSGNSAPSVDGFTTVDETDIKFGLFPPRAITVEGTTASSVELSWDPGTITGEIDRYKVYWDTDSGAATPYAFNSDTHPGQVAFSGTSAVVSGLTPGATYYFTVTSVRDYCEPGQCANNDCAPTCPDPDPSPCPGVSCNLVTPLESLVFPMQVTGGATPIPAEVSAAPGGSCQPTAEVTGVTMARDGNSYRMCWTQPADPCIEGYEVLGAQEPDAAGGFTTVVADTGLTDCWTFDSPARYYVVVGKSAAGTGPWGHYGQ